MALAIHRKARALFDHVRAGAAENLSAGDSIAPDDRRDLFKSQIERTAEYEHHALRRREAFKHGKQCERYVLGTHFRLALGRQRFRQPLPDVGFAPGALIAQTIETQPRRSSRNHAAATLIVPSRLSTITGE